MIHKNDLCKGISNVIIMYKKLIYIVIQLLKLISVRCFEILLLCQIGI